MGSTPCVSTSLTFCGMQTRTNKPKAHSVSYCQRNGTQRDVCGARGSFRYDIRRNDTSTKLIRDEKSRLA
eukprot:4631850-Pyramimonas_sp.AAC.1